ncbi:MAG: hypothetical protein HY901_19060 [Deltaproteobacteria bacterium]|nr:hypothetical protein [Deltaproteobacteria bacterium]
MRKIIVAIVSIAAAGIVLSVFSFVSCIQRVAELDKTSKEFVDTLLPKVGATWDKATVLAEASPDFSEVRPGQPDLDSLFGVFRERLGSMREYQGSQGTSFVNYFNGRKHTGARYRASATFEKGRAEILVQLTQTDAGWKLAGFHVNSPALLGLAPAKEIPIKAGAESAAAPSAPRPGSPAP